MKHQKTVAPDRWNASFLPLRKVLADSEISELITWHLTERETPSLGKRVLGSLRTLHQRFPIRPNPATPRRRAYGGDQEDMRVCMCGIDTYTQVDIRTYKQNDRTLCLCAYTCIYSGARVRTRMQTDRQTHTHTHTHTHPTPTHPNPPPPPHTHTQMGLNHQKGMKSHSLQELGAIFRKAIMLDEAPQISRFRAESTKGYTVNRTEQIRSRLIDTTKEHMGGGQRREGVTRWRGWVGRGRE